LTDEDLLLETPSGEFGSGVVGVCDICHQRQAVIILSKERFKLCVIDFLNKAWVKTEAKPAAAIPPFTSSREYLPSRAVPGGRAPVVVLSPTKVVKRASVLVVPEVFGLTTQVLEAGVRLAHEGFEVILPDFAKMPGVNLLTYARLRGYRMLFDSVPVSQSHREAYLRVLDDCRRYVKSRPLVDPTHFGVLGISYGGALALAYAAQTPEVGTVALAYPFMIRPASWLQSLKAPVLAVYGSEDNVAAPSLILLREAAQRYGFPFESLVLPGVRHHFLNRDLKSYRLPEAELAWARLMAHMKAGLQPPKVIPTPPHLASRDPLAPPGPSPAAVSKTPAVKEGAAPTVQTGPAPGPAPGTTPKPAPASAPSGTGPQRTEDPAPVGPPPLPSPAGTGKYPQKAPAGHASGSP
jgi:carboxymethylenebutenolidase